MDLHHLSVLRALPHLLAPAGRRDLVNQHLPSAPAGRQVLVDLHHLSVLRTLPHLMAPAGRQVLVDLHHLSVLRALPHLLAPVGRRDLVGQHLPSAHPFNGKSCWTSYGIRHL